MPPLRITTTPSTQGDHRSISVAAGSMELGQRFGARLLASGPRWDGDDDMGALGGET